MLVCLLGLNIVLNILDHVAFRSGACFDQCAATQECHLADRQIDRQYTNESELRKQRFITLFEKHIRNYEDIKRWKTMDHNKKKIYKLRERNTLLSEDKT